MAYTKKGYMDSIINIQDYLYLKQQQLAGHVPPRKSLAFTYNPIIRNAGTLFQPLSNCEDVVGPQCSSNHTTCEDEGGLPHVHYRVCAEPLDWDHHPVLLNVKTKTRTKFRHCKLQQWLSPMCTRHSHESHEPFDKYLRRCYIHANAELNSNGRSKHLLGRGDDLQFSYLDAYVYRLFHGTTLKLAKYGVVYPPFDANLFLQLLREECVLLDTQPDLDFKKHMKEADRLVRPSNKQEENYIKIIQLSQPMSLGLALDLERHTWHC